VRIEFDPGKDKLNQAMLKTVPKRTLVMPPVEENRKIVAAAKRDPDAQPLSSAQLKAMVPLKSVRGRPKAQSKKQLVSVRYSPEVVAYFKGTGEGWQSRMDGVLLEYVGKHSRRARKA
jgi:uncharacterized protein (DUF4415 family)